VAFRHGRAIEARQFLADAAELAARLPAATHVLNVCADRYRFTVGLAACLLTQRVSLLPSTHSREVVRELALFAPDAFCLTDDPGCRIELPRFLFPRFTAAAIPWRIPWIATDQLAAIVFTSGSTGTPLPYRKTWGKLERCVRDGAPLLGLADGARHTLIGTVPAQHMYGFESTVLLALLSGNAFSAGRPFYPADICAAVAAVPRPRALISTPLHLRALLRAGLPLPPLDLIVSATAPLTSVLAREVEAAFDTRLVEIYGSTETGQIATRRTAGSESWRLWPGVRLVVGADRVMAQGGHVEQPTPLGDVIELTGDDEFLLHGRTADLVNVAGKRSSFGYLNAQLNAIPGVVDGAFFLGAEPADGGSAGADARGVGADGSAGAHGSTAAHADGLGADGSAAADGGTGAGVTRLAAVVVATLSAAELTDRLRDRIDPVFLPRPLLLVDRLPRNATGKLPHAALKALLERQPLAALGPPAPPGGPHTAPESVAPPHPLAAPKPVAAPDRRAAPEPLTPPGPRAALDPLAPLDRLAPTDPRAALGPLRAPDPLSAPPPRAQVRSTATPARPEPAAQGASEALRAEMRIAEDHGSFAGHFPGFPILPGAVLLDEALHEIERSRSLDLTRWRLAATKFLAAVRPGDALTLEHSAPDEGTIRFVIRTAGRAVASGILSAVTATGHGHDA
jgi:acyl-coenzyme A synthetase/AMP-(fatty) acid ligase/3-hydroxymyristoyl/3-hydroxydecanoyl-(acyl carrier protein) dehydratase